jgi:hypothetical protein
MHYGGVHTMCAVLRLSTPRVRVISHPLRKYTLLNMKERKKLPASHRKTP